MAKTFHERIDEVTKDIYTHYCKHDASIDYCAEWIARLQCRNSNLQTALDAKCEQYCEMLDVRNEQITEANRKVDAGNNLLYEKDVKIAELRESRDRLLEDNGNLRRNRDALRTENGDLALSVSGCSAEIDNRNRKLCEAHNEARILNDNNAMLKRIISEAHTLFHRG